MRAASEERAQAHHGGLHSVYRAGDRRRRGHVPERDRTLHRDRAEHEADGARDGARARGHAPGAAPRHPRAAAGDRRKHRADAPRDRRPDRGAGRAQPHRGPPWPRVRQSVEATPVREPRAASHEARASPDRRPAAPRRAASSCRATCAGAAADVHPTPRRRSCRDSRPAGPRTARRLPARPRPAMAAQASRPASGNRQLALRPAEPRLAAGGAAAAARRGPAEPPAPGDRSRVPRSSGRPGIRSSRSTRSRSTSPA